MTKFGQILLLVALTVPITLCVLHVFYSALFTAACSIETEPKEVSSVSSLGSLTFLVTWRLYVNPLVALLGYHFYLGMCPDGTEVVVLSKSKFLRPGIHTVTILDKDVWMVKDMIYQDE